MGSREGPDERGVERVESEHEEIERRAEEAKRVRDAEYARSMDQLAEEERKKTGNRRTEKVKR
jgi:hypothetical protein